MSRIDQPVPTQMMRLLVGIASLVFSICGCSSNAALVPIKIEYRDDPADEKIELTYLNTSRHAMCLLPEHWPNSAGKINQASDRVSLVVGDERFPIENFNTGYCPNGCATRVAPGETLSAVIPYADFALPDRLIGAPKYLSFSPLAFRCPAK